MARVREMIVSDDARSAFITGMKNWKAHGFSADTMPAELPKDTAENVTSLANLMNGILLARKAHRYSQKGV